MVWTLNQKIKYFLTNNKIEHGSEFENDMGELSVFYEG